MKNRLFQLFLLTACVSFSFSTPIFASEPTSTQVLYQKGQSFLSAGQLTEAADTFKQLVRQSPKDFTAHHQLGITYFQLGRKSEAMTEIKQALQLNPRFAEGHYNLG
ncbi:MAG TPA: tetratricopeptide repeat protein, partial [Acidobacteriota bacterium]|nr:tetratricopeptide repeat protein [Acidobacteriota bacterium]